MDNLFKVLGDENRLRIINLLRRGELCVCEIEIILDTTQSNVSRHLTRLRNEEIVIFEKKAQWTYYQINPEFTKENKLLYKFLIEKMDQNNEFIRDLDRLSKYKESGLNCDNIKEMDTIVFT
ncbi:metalloregulator ArsR/SmtB family transcription factor [Schnuerera sp. xch1]|uniref:ArsR/SmtB family transcription factor n=1 Tax=Schnuerera sp. xch1 TaxID=2874283 RepID=UPI001CBB11A5|nr:metalloregulator ArsR/SmtB family transcription factor [Schnuerera sp. xch1]MBZ2174372.1 metalloregulator ArsR/SmtB family transcription factor [Schnuerera sp. xch1]